ncbi:MAG: HDOD domain-containing protein [bacterium]|nr:HDOD domain-containing protein [bacterium]
MKASEKKKELKKIISLVNRSEISSIKQTVSQIINTINDPKSTAKDLTKLIEIDPPLTARLLKLANSAYYGYAKEISEIQEAIICIGFDAVKELAFSQKVCELFKSDEYISGYTRASLWQHSVGVAICSKLIFRREFQKQGDNIYAAGLLHDLGIIILDQFFHEMFIELLKKAVKKKCNLAEVERDLLGFDHAEIGKALVTDWGLPDEIGISINSHHEPCHVKEEYRVISRTLAISDYVMQEKMIGYCDSPVKKDEIFNNCLKDLKINDFGMDLIVHDVKEELSKMKKAGWF